MHRLNSATLTRFILFAASFLLTMGIVLASGFLPHKEIPGAPYWYSGETRDGWGWTKLNWTAGNSAYAALRQKIDRQIAQSDDPVSVANNYKLSAAANPDEPLAEFAFGYSAFLVSVNKSLPTFTRQKILQDIPDELSKAKFPNTYDYARLRFLAESIVNGKPPLISVGFRLLQIQPQDRHVQYLYAQDLAYSETRPNLDKAISYISNMMTEYPDDPIPYLKRGEMYLLMQQIFGIQDDERKAITDYETFVKMNPPTDTARQDVINWLKSTNSK